MATDKRKARVQRAVTKRPRRQPGVTVHYTDHTCRSADHTLGSPRYVPDPSARDGYSWAGNEVDTVYGYGAYRTGMDRPDGTRHEWMVGAKDDRHIRWGGCHIHRQSINGVPRDPHLHRFTTDRAAVNCEKCLEGLAHTDEQDAERPGKGHMLASCELRQLDAWHLCCRDRGFARPAVDIAKARADLDAEERQRLALVIDGVVSAARGLIAAVAMGAPPDFDDFAAKLAAKLPAAVFAELHGLLHETEFATQVALEAYRVSERAIAAGRAVRARMIDGSIPLDKNDRGTAEPDVDRLTERSERRAVMNAAVSMAAEPGMFASVVYVPRATPAVAKEAA